MHAPLLPGHGRTIEEFHRSRARDWTAYARERYDFMADAYERVAIAGVSMGGAIAAIIAADAPRLSALVLLAPYVSMPRFVAAAVTLHRAWGPLVGPFRASSSRSILDPVERERNLAYGVTTASALRQLLGVARAGRRALGSITAPTLIVQSRLDNRVSPRVAQRVYRAIPAARKKLVFVERGGHILTVDHDRKRVAAEAGAWLNEHMG